MIVRRAPGPYCFEEVLRDPFRMHIFEDNPQRTSDRDYHYEIPRDSWYSIRYRNYRKDDLYRDIDGKTACIRGLINAYPLCTIANLHGKFWSDSDLAAFKELLEDDIYQILKGAQTDLITEVIVPPAGIFGTSESGITESRCPAIYWHLRERMDWLWGILRMV